MNSAQNTIITNELISHIVVLNQIKKCQKILLKSNLVQSTDLSKANITKYSLWKLQTSDKRNDSKFHNNTNSNPEHILGCIGFITITIICFVIGVLNFSAIDYFMSIRCLLPNNYLIWESTRPISNCEFCTGVNRPIVLPNITEGEFLNYAYLPQPIIIKNAITHWSAREQLTFQLLKKLYHANPDILNNFNEECQFLPFKSKFASLKEFLDMPESRIVSGKPPFYVGFSNCLSNIIYELRKLYPRRPHFLPADAEIPHTDYIFLGYNAGAVMHLDYIPRLMWQAQLQGNKTWNVGPTPECDSKCSHFSFYVEAGDIVLIDTRIWYHGTKAEQFSITLQSEYG